MQEPLEQTILATRKAAMRAQLKQIRAAIPAEQRAAWSQTIHNTVIALDEVRNARTVFIYISYGNEVDTHGLLKHFLNAGKSLAVQKILTVKTMIATPFSNWKELVLGELGILTPPGNESHPGPFDVVITPGLGFTRQGHRIGYGRGYYDQWFATHQVQHKIAVTFEAQLVAELPVDATDIPVNMIVTEKRVIRI